MGPTPQFETSFLKIFEDVFDSRSYPYLIGNHLSWRLPFIARPQRVYVATYIVWLAVRSILDHQVKANSREHLS